MGRNITENTEARERLAREVRYRLSYRGTLELDLVCRRFLPRVEGLGIEKMEEIRDLLLEREGDLMAWLVEGKEPPAERLAAVNMLKNTQ
jgi:succinate dehydrogenase flavin-adding protein (antitoxin of CptAB toxin-antitoxin module)